MVTNTRAHTVVYYIAIVACVRNSSMCQRLILILKGVHREPWEKGLARHIILRVYYIGRVH